jgi:hypothetical protein
MTLKGLLTVSSVVAFVFGVGFVTMPTQLTSAYNVALTPGGAFIGQLFGAALIGFGVLNWSARGIENGRAIGAIVLANLVANAVGFVLALLGQLSSVGGVNQLGWSIARGPRAGAGRGDAASSAGAGATFTVRLPPARSE